MFSQILQKILKFLAIKIIQKQNPQIVGITGSVGKSSAKETSSLILKTNFKVGKTWGNYNNEIGLPLTVIGKNSPGKNLLGWLIVFISGLRKSFFKIKSYPEVLVLEMAADRPGDIRYLLKIAPCQVGVLTAIDLAHTEFFKNIEGVVKEKQNIITHLSSEHWAILNADDDKVWPLKEKTQAKIITYGFSSQADLQILEWKIEQEVKESGLEIKGSSFKISYQGKVVPMFLPQIISLAQIYSVLAGLAVGLTFNINLLEMAKALKDYQPLPGRLSVLKGKNKSLILDDTYNSSPRAVKSALKTIEKINLPLNSKKWALLGDMLELGELSLKAHYQIGQEISEMNFDYLITIGKEAKAIAQGARQSGFKEEGIFSFNSCLGVVDFILPRIKRGDLILIKGSQATRMERIVKGLMSQPHLAKKYLVRQSRSWLKT